MIAGQGQGVSLRIWQMRHKMRAATDARHRSESKLRIMSVSRSMATGVLLAGMALAAIGAPGAWGARHSRHGHAQNALRRYTGS